MAPVFAEAREIEPGRYQAHLTFAMAGDWVILLHIMLPGGQKLERQIRREGRPTQLGKLLNPSSIPALEAPESLPFDLMRVPGLGHLFRWRYARPLLQAPLLIVSVVMILHGLFGPTLAPKNLATTLSWLHFRGVLVLVLLCAGNFFCLACPFMLVRQAARRFFKPRFDWPRALRNKWLSVALFVLILFTYELFDLWSSPWWTAWLILAYFVTVLVVDGFFKHASFCKFVCPIGQFNFVASTLSPFEVKVRDQEVCTSCHTLDCIRGRREPVSDLVVIRGCELALFQPRKVGNMDCTFCLDCVHACPHDNVGILSRLPGTELLTDPMRSGIGYFSRRKDLAALAIVFTFGALLNAFGMVSPVYAVERWLGRMLHVSHEAPVLGIIFAFFLILEPVLLLGLAAWLTRAWAGSQRALAAADGAIHLRPCSHGLRDVAGPLRLSFFDRTLHHHSRNPERAGESGMAGSGRTALDSHRFAGECRAGRSKSDFCCWALPVRWR